MLEPFTESTELQQCIFYLLMTPLSNQVRFCMHVTVNDTDIKSRSFSFQQSMPLTETFFKQSQSGVIDTI